MDWSRTVAPIALAACALAFALPAQAETYSARARLGDSNTSQCFDQFDGGLPGAADDTVTFDAVAEDTRTLGNGTIPELTESEEIDAGGVRRITITLSSTNGGELYPDGVASPVPPHDPHDAVCFYVGLDDPLTFDGPRVVDSASLTFSGPGIGTLGPFNVPASFFGAPAAWDGTLATIFPPTTLAVGTDIRQVVLQITFVSNCGDGVLDSGEECDDGNTANGDGCEANCLLEACFSCDGEPSVCSLTCLDHYKCYKAKKAKGAAKFQKLDATFDDPFESKVTTLKKPSTYCLPVDKNGEGILDATAHLECYKAKDAKTDPKQFPFPGLTIQALNQFGAQPLELSRAREVCVPAERDGVPSALQLDHFKCYASKTAKGQESFARVDVTLADALETKITTVTGPTALCAPADKNDEGVLFPRAHLQCFKIRDAKTETGPSFDGTTLSTENQFGTEQLELKKPSTVCVPSTTALF